MTEDDSTTGTRFRATLELGGKTATGIEVSSEVLAALGAGKRPDVTVTIGSHSYRSTIGVMGGRSLLPVSAEHRRAAGIEAGDEVDVELELDTEPREVVVPGDLTQALADEPVARQFFDGLSYSRRWHVLNIEGAETAETRKRRIDKSVDLLRQERAR